MSHTFKWCVDKTRLAVYGKQVFCINTCWTKRWWLNGELHREDGPAVEYANGNKAWWLNDKLHRVNGPAVEYGNGDKDWWLHGRHYSESAYWKELQK